MIHVHVSVLSFGKMRLTILCASTVSGMAHMLANYQALSYGVAPVSEITTRNKINKLLVVYRFTGNVMTSITTLRTQCQ